MTFRRAVLNHKQPSDVLGALAVGLQRRHQRRWHRDAALLKILWRKANILLRSDVKLHLLEIDVLPCGVLRLLLAACSSQKEFVMDHFVFHRSEQLFQVLLTEWDQWVSLEYRQVSRQREARGDFVFLQQRQDG